MIVDLMISDVFVFNQRGTSGPRQRLLVAGRRRRPPSAGRRRRDAGQPHRVSLGTRTSIHADFLILNLCNADISLHGRHGRPGAFDFCHRLCPLIAHITSHHSKEQSSSPAFHSRGAGPSNNAWPTETGAAAPPASPQARWGVARQPAGVGWAVRAGPLVWTRPR